MPRPGRIRVSAIFAAICLIAAIVIALPVSPQTSTTGMTVAVMGDLGITGTTERNVDLAVSGGAQGLIGLGDYNYDASMRGWNALVKPLTDRGVWLALGNHDRLADFRTRMPGENPQWSMQLSGVRVIGINTQESLAPGSPQHAWLTAELSAEPASAAKILVAHKPWWLGAGAQHPANQFPGDPATMDALMASHGVDMVFAGHEHNYQRTQRNNVPYLIVGTGGVSLYPIAGADPGTVATCVCYGHVLLTLTGIQVSARFVDVDGAQRDTITVSTSGNTVKPTFDATFTGVRGNEWWVQAQVASNGPSVVKVEVTLDNGATWRNVEWRGWGWGTSTRIVQGTIVQMRATATDGQTDLSSCRQWIPPPDTDATIVSCGARTTP